MKEESIYRILEPYEDHTAEERRLKKEKRDMLLSKKPEFVLPTASTFINNNTVRPGVCNHGGLRHEDYIMKQHKKSYSTLGKPRFLVSDKKGCENNKENNDFRASVPEKRVSYKETFQAKPNLPDINDRPLVGLSSNVNFIKENLLRNKSLTPLEKVTLPSFLQKKEYGVIPSYLGKIKNSIEKEKEYLEMLKNVRDSRPPSKYTLEESEVSELKSNLKEQFDAVTRQYQGLTHVSKVIPHTIKQKKEDYERKLDELDKYMKLMSNPVIQVKI